MDSQKYTEAIQKVLETKIYDFGKYHDGFSFTVKTELEAYKAAYKYQGQKRVVVKYAENVDRWLVQVYTNDFVSECLSY